MESSKRVSKLIDMALVDIKKVQENLVLLYNMEQEKVRILHMKEKAQIMANIDNMSYNKKRFKL